MCCVFGKSLWHVFFLLFAICIHITPLIFLSFYTTDRDKVMMFCICVLSFVTALSVWTFVLFFIQADITTNQTACNSQCLMYT